MSLVGELGRERFLHDALEPVLHSCDTVVIDTPCVTLATLAERLATPAPELIAVRTRWHPNRISSRSIEAGLAGSDLAPVARIRLRSAALAHAAVARVSLALGAPDSPVALAYQRLVEQLQEVGDR